MSEDATASKITYGNVCLFCTRKMEEHFYSGSHDTYFTCRCEDMARYRDLYEKLAALVRKADVNKQKIVRKERIETLRDQLKHLEREEA